ncbi:axonemal dynein light intermediate polypeptide 1 isoform X1 [Pogoniulus pusillus]|uniref:axonemal dynein light intermediate polypeptide 1 isoform X1 n=1 Tax=Pogoniulus pusillus TaxID=488313 RepID=UPI0030B92814
MILPPDSLLRYHTPVLVTRRTEKRSPKVRRAQQDVEPRVVLHSLLRCSVLSAGVSAAGKPVAARPDRARPTTRRRVREAGARTPQRHPAASGVGGGEPPMGAGGVQRSRHPPGRRSAPGAVGPEAAAAAGAGDRDLPGAPGALLAVLRESLRLPFPPSDELIRQTTIACAERGLLLLRVRDELQMTLAAYQTLYESSTAFGLRKALQAEQGRADMEKRIAELEKEKQELERQVSEQKALRAATERREEEKRQIEEKKHAEEVQVLKKINQQLKAQLESIVAANK